MANSTDKAPIRRLIVTNAGNTVVIHTREDRAVESDAELDALIAAETSDPTEQDDLKAEVTAGIANNAAE